MPLVENMSSSGLNARSSEENDNTATAKDVELTKELPKEFSYEESLGIIGFGKVQLENLFVCGMLRMLAINETMGMSIIIIASQCDFNTSSQEKAIMSVACFIGIVVASYPLGYLSDTCGRRIVLVRATIAAITFSFLSMWVSNVWVFVTLRFLTGLGIAGATATVFAYLGEFNTLKYRPVVINYANMFVGISRLYSPAVAWLILPQTWNVSIFGIFFFRPWRLLILFNLLPGLIAVIWLWTLPESPKLYLSHGKNTEALNVLYWIYEKNTGNPSKEFQVKRLVSEENEQFFQMLPMKKTTWDIFVRMWRQTSPLFKRPLVLNFLVCCFVMFGLFFTSSGMGLWYPEIQNRLGFGANDVQMTICDVISDRPTDMHANNTNICNDEVTTKMYIDSMILGVSNIVLYIILGIAINPLGRKTVLAGNLVISGCCGLALQWISQPVAVVALFVGFLAFPGLSISVLSGAVVDLIPTHLRGTAVCICLMLGRFGSVIGSNLIGAILEQNCEITFYIFSGFIIFCSILTLSLPI